jgi:regulator of protease activity HflC (stomatin/prohibitin superfamily)
VNVTHRKVQNIEVDKSTEESMAKQSAAERNRRVCFPRVLRAIPIILTLPPLSIPPFHQAMVLTSEGERTSAVNKSEGQRASAINNSEGERQAMINTAEGR